MARAWSWSLEVSAGTRPGCDSPAGQAHGAGPPPATPRGRLNRARWGSVQLTKRSLGWWDRGGRRPRCTLRTEPAAALVLKAGCSLLKQQKQLETQVTICQRKHHQWCEPGGPPSGGAGRGRNRKPPLAPNRLVPCACHHPLTAWGFLLRGFEAKPEEARGLLMQHLASQQHGRLSEGLGRR